MLKELLSNKLTAEQFIKQLEAKGIDVRFNQASTGLVSGSSYAFEGMQFKGLASIGHRMSSVELFNYLMA